MMPSLAAAPPTPYRADIDGLRALAVLSVLAFHAAPGVVGGGFVGVDIFFVISGYLITRTIVQECDAGEVSLARFYARRARRIFPALVLVLVTTLALGTLVLPAHEMERLGRHVVAGATFSSNLLLWHEAGYFDPASTTKPLLHLWSLGIEEQFYLVWPLVMLAIARLGHLRLRATLLIALASFALNVALVERDHSATFYSPATRAWELMAGASLAIVLLRTGREALGPRTRDWAAAVGIAMLVAAIALFDDTLAFPGWYALLPVVGTVLVIAAGGDAVVNRRALAHPWAVAIGLGSYPLYLWHWPLLVLARRAYGVTATADLPVVVTLGALAVAAGAAWLTWRLLERPIRRAELPAMALRATFALGVTGLFGGLQMVSRAGFDRDALTAEQARNDWATPKSPDAVYHATTGSPPAVLFVGDSHAEQYYPAVVHSAQRLSPVPAIAFSTHGGCAFLPDYRVAQCGDYYARSMRLAASSSVRRVVIASAWDMYALAGPQGEGFIPDTTELAPYFRALASDIARLRALGKEVVLIGLHPHADVADPELLAAHTRVGVLGTRAATRFAASFPLDQYRARNAGIDTLLAEVGKRSGATIVDPAQVLCPAGACVTMDAHGTPLRKDSNHLRPFAAVQLLTYVPALVAPLELAR